MHMTIITGLSNLMVAARLSGMRVQEVKDSKELDEAWDQAISDGECGILYLASDCAQALRAKAATFRKSHSSPVVVELPSIEKRNHGRIAG